MKQLLLQMRTVPASQTNLVVSESFRSESPVNARVNVLVGKVVAATGNTLGVMQSPGWGVWAATKTTAITASTDTTVSAVSTTTGALTAAGHGLVAGDYVALNSSTTIPAGFSADTPYQVIKVSGNDVSLGRVGSDIVIIPTTEGSGTITITKCRTFSVQFLDTVAGDQGYLPLCPQLRVVITTQAGDSV